MHDLYLCMEQSKITSTVSEYVASNEQIENEATMLKLCGHNSPNLSDISWVKRGAGALQVIGFHFMKFIT